MDQAQTEKLAQLKQKFLSAYQEYMEALAEQETAEPKSQQDSSNFVDNDDQPNLSSLIEELEVLENKARKQIAGPKKKPQLPEILLEQIKQHPSDQVITEVSDQTEADSVGDSLDQLSQLAKDQLADYRSQKIQELENQTKNIIT